ncbi:MAG: T9SS type A sorting domain-containing protein [Bacteroidales bacterium]
MRDNTDRKGFWKEHGKGIIRWPSTVLKLVMGFLTAYLSTAMAFGSADTVNLALSAVVTTSHVSSWETLGAVNDGYNPTSSSDKSQGAYGNWRGEDYFNTFEWVQYEWPLAKNLTSTSVYWWDDGLGILQPDEARIEYWNGVAWINAGPIGTMLNTYNSLKLAIQTSRIRIYMKSPRATGILEWRVFGVESGPCDPTEITPFVKDVEGSLVAGNTVNVIEGDGATFSPQDNEGGTWYWGGPGGFTATGRELTVENLTAEKSGTYTVFYTNSCGAQSQSYFHLTVRTDPDPSAPYDWPDYDPVINYDFRDEFPGLTEPTQDLDDCAGVVGTQSSGWWTFKWGANANSLVTSAAITPMLNYMNQEFAYFRDVMGWPPDKRAKNGYRSAIYLYGSGLCTDNASNTALGGWQSSIFYQGQHWPMVLISYYPVYSFDPACTYGDRQFQRDAVVHEGIHSILADMPGVKQAAWFHEGGNTWLQQEATARRTGNYSSMGFLNGASYIAPFMPIECYSGWLQDGSFGGPSAEGVNMFEDGQQICTWRNLLGGVQYSNAFPTFLGITLGPGSIPWIWRNAPGRVLEGIANGMGEHQTRRLITEYRAKQALVDMGPWTQAVMNLLNSQTGTAIRADWQPSWLNPDTWYATPYVVTTKSSTGLLTPEQRTTPGWSGSNQIPLRVNGNKVTINFIPLGPNMTCQLAYRTKEGLTVYSQPVYGGDCSLRLDHQPANSVVFAIVSSTEYIYHGDVTRKTHHDYRIQLVEGVTGTADVNKKWFDWTKTIEHTGINDRYTLIDDILLYPNPVQKGTPVSFSSPWFAAMEAEVSIMNMTGNRVWSGRVADGSPLPEQYIDKPGIYFVEFKGQGGRGVKKLIVK